MFSRGSFRGLVCSLMTLHCLFVTFVIIIGFAVVVLLVLVVGLWVVLGYIYGRWDVCMWCGSGGTLVYAATGFWVACPYGYGVLFFWQ